MESLQKLSALICWLFSTTFSYTASKSPAPLLEQILEMSPEQGFPTPAQYSPSPSLLLQPRLPDAGCLWHCWRLICTAIGASSHWCQWPLGELVLKSVASLPNDCPWGVLLWLLCRIRKIVFVKYFIVVWTRLNTSCGMANISERRNSGCPTFNLKCGRWRWLWWM